MRGHTRRAVLADMRHEHLALAGVRLRQHLAVLAQPFGTEQAMLGVAVGVPAGRVATAKAVQQLLRLHQRQVAGADAFKRQVDHAAAALARADLLLHTCPEEPFGLVLLEAFAAGVPVLVPNSGGAGDIVHEGVNGWRFSANNAVALGQRLQVLATMPAPQLNAMAAGGHASLLQTFAPAHQVALYAELARAAA